MKFEDKINKLTELAESLKDISAEEWAQLFSSSDDEKQAEILDEIATEFKRFNGCLQNCYLAEKLSDRAKEWVKNLYAHIIESEAK